MYEIFENLCKLNGITAYRFCKETGVNSSTISTWKRKNSIARPELAQVVCDYFNVSLDYLMTGKDAPEELTTLSEEDKEYLSVLAEVKKLGIPASRLRAYIKAMKELEKE